MTVQLPVVPRSAADAATRPHPLDSTTSRSTEVGVALCLRPLYRNDCQFLSACSRVKKPLKHGHKYIHIAGDDEQRRWRRQAVSQPHVKDVSLRRVANCWSTQLISVF
jgi:hypothetical protein